MTPSVNSDDEKGFFSNMSSKMRIPMDQISIYLP